MLYSKLLLSACFFTSISFVAAQKSFPDVEVYTLDGQKVQLKEHVSKGKISVISMWATWCSPCKKELDAFAELYEDWQEEFDVEIIAITIDTRRALAKVPAMIATKNWEYTIFSDPNNSLRNSLQFQSIPQTFLVDQEGQIVYSHNGYVAGDEYELEDEIKALTE